MGLVLPMLKTASFSSSYQYLRVSLIRICVLIFEPLVSSFLLISQTIRLRERQAEEMELYYPPCDGREARYNLIRERREATWNRMGELFEA